MRRFAPFDGVVSEQFPSANPVEFPVSFQHFMATQHDNIDVANLVKIGLVSTIVIIAVSYYVTGLTYVERQGLKMERTAVTDASAAAAVEVPAAPSEGSRKAVIDKYAR